jgi:hypothetical protein
MPVAIDFKLDRLRHHSPLGLCHSAGWVTVRHILPPRPLGEESKKSKKSANSPPVGRNRSALQVNRQFRAQAFNLFNHPNFGLPNTLIASSTFGVINALAGQEPSRVMQFALRFEF